MSRNNDERSGAHPSADAPVAAVAQAAQGNSMGLNFVVPTEHVELPSQLIAFYKVLLLISE
mgnify:CR=1 FL=1